MTFSEKLVGLRRKAGLSQEELASRLEVSRQAVSKWESGQTLPDLERAAALSRLFGVSLDYLLKEELEAPEAPQPEPAAPPEPEKPLRRVSPEEARQVLELSRAAAQKMALATGLCIVSPTALILLAALSENSWFALGEAQAAGVGLCVLLVLVAAAVALRGADGGLCLPGKGADRAGAGRGRMGAPAARGVLGRIPQRQHLGHGAVHPVDAAHFRGHGVRRPGLELRAGGGSSAGAGGHRLCFVCAGGYALGCHEQAAGRRRLHPRAQGAQRVPGPPERRLLAGDHGGVSVLHLRPERQLESDGLLADLGHRRGAVRRACGLPSAAASKAAQKELKLGSGDVDKTKALTVVDKIPDGMKLATDKNSLGSYRIAADLDTAWGNKYTGGITKLGENQYGFVFGRDTYWSIDTSVSGQLTIKVLPITLQRLIDSKKTTDHYVEIRYALQLDDASAWNERTLEEKTYTNAATWDGASTSSGMTITRPKKELLEKTGDYDEKTHQANYTLCINPRAEDLAPGSDTLELTDTMESTYFGKTGMELMLDSIKVYEYILQDGDWVKGNEVKDGVRVEKVEETASTRKYKFVLPDEKALVLEYSYKMNPGNLATDMSVKNTAALAGKKSVGSNVPVKNDSASATVHNAVLTVAKTDSATNLAITASPATFEIYHYNRISQEWDFIRTENTGSNGSFDLTFAQSPATGSPQLVTGDLYKLVETAAPEDYAPDATPHYFIWNNNATDDDKKAAALTTATGATVLEGVTTANVSFLGVNGDRATMAIPNKQNCLTLRKIWYGVGNDTIEAPVKEIQVQLYRYKDGTNKADAETVGTVTLTKADGWTKKISSLESGYHYYVEELGTDSGALVFYEVKYSESNDTGVTGGGTITITNKQKPSYELPATGAAGTPPYTAAGALIMGIALMLGYLINKRSHSGGGKNLK